MLPSLWPWAFLATNLVISFHCVCYNFAFLFISYYPVGLRADVLAISTHFFINPLLRASLAQFPLLYLFWAYWLIFLPCQPILPLYSLGFFNPFTTSLPLFTPMGLLLNSFSFLSLFTTLLPLITFLGLLAIKANPLSLPIHSLGFPDPFTSFLPLIIPLGLLLHSLGFLGPYFFTSFYFRGSVGHQSCCFSPLGLFSYFFTVLPPISFLPSLLLGLFCCWALCQKWASTTWLIDIRKYDRFFILNVINIEIIKLMEIYSIFWDRLLWEHNLFVRFGGQARAWLERNVPSFYPLTTLSSLRVWACFVQESHIA